MGTQTHLPPKFSFSSGFFCLFVRVLGHVDSEVNLRTTLSSDFGHFIFKMVENAKFSTSIHRSVSTIIYDYLDRCLRFVYLDFFLYR